MSKPTHPPVDYSESLDPVDVLHARLDQVRSLLDVLSTLFEDDHGREPPTLSNGRMRSALWGIETLQEQAITAAKAITYARREEIEKRHAA